MKQVYPAQVYPTVQDAVLMCIANILMNYFKQIVWPLGGACKGQMILEKKKQLKTKVTSC